MSDTKTWTHDEEIRSWAEKFIEKHELTQSQFTGRLAGNFSTTRVAKYLNLDKNGAHSEPDAPKVETAVRNLRRHELRIGQFEASLYENSVTRDVKAVFNQIRRTGDVALIHSDGGEGKTCGAILFCRDNPDSLFVTARYPYGCSDWSVMAMVFEEFNNSLDKKWDGHGDKWVWMEKHLRGTERLLIIDDAELLHVSAFRWAFSLHDSTGMPIAFIGNNEVIDKISRRDSSGKMISRIGIVHHARMKDDADATAARLVAQFAPDSGDALLDEVTRTIAQFGHSRRARKQLTLASNIFEGMKGEKEWKKAYAYAGTKLINPTRK